jgi:hypothetical protein
MTDEWRKKAACRGLPIAEAVETFHPRGQWPDKHRAQDICAVCTVQAECLHYVLVTVRSGDDHGIWAGTNKSQRAKMRHEMLQEAS